ncbi:MAG: class I SAM-dependent methyltransferase [bacterium]
MTPLSKTTDTSTLNEDVNLEDELPFWSAPFGIRLLNHIHYKKGLSALDIGFGTGFPLTEIAMRLGDTSRVFGIDPREEGIGRTRKKLSFYGIKNTELIKGEAENIPLPNLSMDLVCSNNGLNNVSDMGKAISECSRILKPGGQFIQTFNLKTTMREFYDIMEKVFTEMNMGSALEKMHQHIYQKRKPLEEVVKKLEKHRFSIREIIKDQFEYKFADGEAMLNHFAIKTDFASEWRKIAGNEREEAVFDRIRELISVYVQEIGCFKLTVPFVLVDCEKNPEPMRKYNRK